LSKATRRGEREKKIGSNFNKERTTVNQFCNTCISYNLQGTLLNTD
jgi:hypothetical protein